MLVALHLKINTVDEPGHENDDFFMRESSFSTNDCRRVDDFMAGPLASASACGHREVMHILLKNGANVNMSGGYHGSALASASAYGCKQVVQILLEMGADVNMDGGGYGGALASASAEGCKEVVQILLENKANMNMTGGQYGSALASASAEVTKKSHRFSSRREQM